MLSRVTLHCHVTTIALNICSQSLQNIDCYKIKYFLPRFISPLTQCSGAARCSSKENGLQISIFVYLNFSIFAYFHFSKYLTIWSSTKSLFLLYICIFHTCKFAFLPYFYICFFSKFVYLLFSIVVYLHSGIFSRLSRMYRSWCTSFTLSQAS